MLRPIDATPSTLWNGLEPRIAERLRTLIPDGDPIVEKVWRRSVARPLRLFLRRPSKELRALLTRWGWSLGRKDQPPEALPLLIELIHAGSLVMDDIQDGTQHRRGEKSLHQSVGVPLALNAAASLYFLPFSILPELELPPEAELRLHRRMADAMLTCCHGQSLDLGAKVDAIPPSSLRRFVETASEWKTGRLMGLAAELGAIAGRADDETTDAARLLATSIGVGLQMLNDLSEISQTENTTAGFEDLRERRASWIWVWVQDEVSPSRSGELVNRLLELTGRNGSTDALDAFAAELRQIVETRARREIHDRFRPCVDHWRERFGEAYDLEPLLAELDRLERSYVR
jgi:geranylgeranyl pyrophosphate synthase